MLEIKEGSNLAALKSNTFIGAPPKMTNSCIRFHGERNILVCEEGITLFNSTITFHGNNSIIFLRKSKHEYKVNITVYDDNCCYIGCDNYMNRILNIIFSEQRHCIIGDDGLFSFGIWIRNADPHLIYGCQTKQRLPRRPCLDWPVCNDFKGDTNRLRQHFSGNECSIQEKIEHNTVYAGDSCKRVCESCFWDESCVHTW